jgi:acyl-CoA synthetase (AMP-forming)/AMP-acid ligase II
VPRQACRLQAPALIIFITPEQMPRNATGKILHRLLREQLG